MLRYFPADLPAHVRAHDVGAEKIQQGEKQEMLLHVNAVRKHLWQPRSPCAQLNMYRRLRPSLQPCPPSNRGVHTARRSYQLGVLVKCSDWLRGVATLLEAEKIIKPSNLESGDCSPSNVHETHTSSHPPTPT